MSPKSGGGLKAIFYTLQKARQAGGLWRMWKALRSKNACKTCALGMGGQKGGMVNESGVFPSFCKKSVQALAADLQNAIPESFFQQTSLQQMRTLSPRECESLGRLTYPLYAGKDDTHYRRINWDEAFEHISIKLKQTNPDESFFYFSGRSSNEAGFLMQLFARLYGTNNVNNCSYYCHQASGAGLTSVTGSGTATVVLEDVEHCDLLFIIGANPASNHPRLLHTIIKMKRRGGKVIVINPIKEVGLCRFRVPSDPISLLFGSQIADLYIQPNIGGDMALLYGAAKSLIAMNAIDSTFINQCTENSESFIQKANSLSWDEITAQSGVSKAEIEKISNVYANSKNTIFSWAMGITHHAHGVQSVQLTANLAMMRGMVGKAHAGLLPIRGHSNVQGIGSMGVTPQLKQEIFNRLESEFHIQLPTNKGMDTLSCMEQAAAGNIRFMSCLGGNLYGSNPDSRFSERAFQATDMVLYMNTTMNTGHIFGRGKETLILPVLARDEEPQKTTQESMFNYVRLSDGGANRFVDVRSEVEVIARIAHNVLGSQSPIDWNMMQEHKNIRAAIAKIIPGYQAIGEIDDSKREFQIEGRTFHRPSFATPSKKAIFHAVDLPRLQRNENEFCLMTIRSEGQFNTVVYEEEDVYRGQDCRNVIMMNARDRQRLGLEINQYVTVRSALSRMDRIIVREIDIREGNMAMYYPEANVLIPRTADAVSRTPAFKSVMITVSPT